MIFTGKKLAAALGAVLGSASVASIVAATRRYAPLSGGGLALPGQEALEPGPARKVGVVRNPVKGRSDEARETIVRAAERAGWAAPVFYETTREDPGEGQARQAVADGCEIVVAAGGDGTVRAVASALEDADVVMGLVPLGTGNLLARNLRLPWADLHACVETALHGTPRDIDTIGVRTMPAPQEDEASPEAEDHTYLIMGGAGFDAVIMDETTDDLKSRWGWLAYVHVGLRNLVSVRHSVTLTIDGGEPFRRRTRSVLVSNTGELTGGIRLAQDSTVDDGRLEVIVITPRNLLGWGTLLAQVVTRRSFGQQVIEHFHGHEVTVDFLAHPLPMEVDGDPLGEVTSFTAAVRPASLRVNTAPDDLSPFRSLANLRAGLHRRARLRLAR